MNYALIFAGGTGSRMTNTATPKQFLEVNNKPIIIYTIEKFDNHPGIDEIIVVCLASHIEYLGKLLARFHIKKVKKIIPGGNSGQESIFNGLSELHKNAPSESIVLIHDGVRPLIDADTIANNIKTTSKYGNAITSSPAIETIIEKKGSCSDISQILDRQNCFMARAPQTFYLDDIYKAHKKAIVEGELDFVDSASLMKHYGEKLHIVVGPPNNIKITVPADYYVFCALKEAEENANIFG